QSPQSAPLIAIASTEPISTFFALIGECLPGFDRCLPRWQTSQTPPRSLQEMKLKPRISSADDGGGIIREVDVEGGVHLLVRPATEGNFSGLGCNIGRGQQCPRWDNRGVISVY